MKIDNVSFPYPVLGINDDIMPGLSEDSVSITIDESDNSIFIFNVTLRVNNEDILSYISTGKAVYSVELSCQQTMFRRCIESTVPTFCFEVERKRLNGKLQFECYVVAKNTIADYQNRGMNEDYLGHIINLRKGDILVAFPHCEYPLNLDLRNIRNPKSFISVVPNKDVDEKFVKYDLDSEKIIIIMPANLYVLFKDKDLAKNAKEQMKASIYLNALTYALLHLRSYRNQEKIWVQTLNFRLREKDLAEQQFDVEELFDSEQSQDSSQDSTMEIFRLAQALLKDPYIDFFRNASGNESFEKITFD